MLVFPEGIYVHFKSHIPRLVHVVFMTPIPQLFEDLFHSLKLTAKAPENMPSQ